MPRESGTGTSDERRCVVMLTCSYAGENEDVERELHDRLDLARVLQGIVALNERGALTSAHLHVAPAHPDDRLTDEQMLGFDPETRVPLPKANSYSEPVLGHELGSVAKAIG